MQEKEEREGKCYLKVVVPMVVGLGQAFLSNQNNVVMFMKLTFIDLFSIYIFTIPNMNRIMQDPNMKIIPFIWPVLKNHHGIIMVTTYVQQKNVNLNFLFGLNSWTETDSWN